MRRQHETSKKLGERLGLAERQDLRDVLVRPHHDQATGLFVDATHVVNILLRVVEGAKGFFIIVQTVVAFGREQQRRQGGYGEAVMALLKDSPDVDHGIYVRA